MNTPQTGRSKLAKAIRAIRKGRTMGQYLRELPNSRQMSKEQLQDWAKVYVEARKRTMKRYA